MRRLLHALALLGLLSVALAPSDVHGQEYVYSAADTEAAMAEHSWLAGCIVYAETGGTLDPYAVGQAGERGVAQLHPRGELQTFYAMGYDNPYSPYQSMDFLDWALDNGRGHYWTTYWGCT